MGGTERAAFFLCAAKVILLFHGLVQQAGEHRRWGFRLANNNAHGAATVEVRGVLSRAAIPPPGRGTVRHKDAGDC